MKIAILLVDGAKQIMMTPENDHEKQALKMIAPGDKLQVVTKWGTFTGIEEIRGVSVDKCQGGYYRGYESSESLMFVIEDKKEKK